MGGSGTPLYTVTVTDVRAILDTNMTDAQLTAFIVAADQIFFSVYDSGAYALTLENEIIRWLSAHLATVRAQEYQSQSIGDASVTRRVATGKGLDSSFYGQQVKMLDTTGYLSKLGKSTVTFGVAYEVEDA